MNNENEFNWKEIFDTTIKKLDDDLAVDQIYENGSHVKYKVTKLDSHFIVMHELNGDGSITKDGKRFERSSFIGLIYNKYFEKTRIARRETFLDLKKYDVGSLYRK